MERLDHPARSCFYVHLECAAALPRGAVSWQARSSLFAETPPSHPARRIFDPACHRQLRAPSEKAESKNSRGCVRAQNHELTYFDHGGE